MTALRQRLHALLRRLRLVGGRDALERDLDDELRFHLAMREDEARASGLSADEAREAALRRFGNAATVKEEAREVWTFPRLETLLQDARFALRLLRRNPGFTAAAVLSLGLGIGANAAMFSMVSAILLRPLPYPEADRLVRLTGFYPRGALVAIQERARAYDVAGASTVEMNLTGPGGAQRVVGGVVSANLFDVLGVGSVRGRGFATGEDRPGRDRLVVLSHALWQQRYAGDASILGRTIRVGGVDRQVVGVMPASFHFPTASTQLWIPLRLDPALPDAYWGFGWMPLVARLRPGATLAQARGELASTIPAVAALFPWPNPGWNQDSVVRPLQEDLVEDVRTKLLVLQCAVGLVLLIACANVANLVLSRGAARRKEMALRAALGAGRGRLLRQGLAESLVLALFGGAVGVGLAFAAMSAVETLVPAETRGFAHVGLDAGVLAFVTALSVVSGLLFGALPAAVAARVDLAGAMKAGGQKASGSAGARLRSSFITAEVALAVVLTIGAGLFVRTLRELTTVDPGFRAERTLSVRLSPNPAVCPDRPTCLAYYEDLVRRVGSVPGAHEVAATSALPLSGDEPLLPVEMEGHPLKADDAVAPLVWAGGVTPGYFRAMAIPIVRGRGFDDGDGASTTPVVIVDASTARRYWPGEDAVGKRVRVAWDTEARTVVGVAGDVRQYALSGRTPKDVTGALYMPYPQAVGLDRQLPTAMALVVRFDASAASLERRIRDLVASGSDEVAVSELRSLETVVAASVAEPRSMMWLFGAFAGCALALAAIGTYGVVSYTTAQRSYEIGVRVAIGATRRDIFGLVLGQSLRLCALGIAIGLVAALALGRSLSGLLYGVSAADPLTFAAVSALLLVTALVAGYVPGRRAAATSPVRALRVD